MVRHVGCDHLGPRGVRSGQTDLQTVEHDARVGASQVVDPQVEPGVVDDDAIGVAAHFPGGRTHRVDQDAFHVEAHLVVVVVGRVAHGELHVVHGAGEIDHEFQLVCENQVPAQVVPRIPIRAGDRCAHKPVAQQGVVPRRSVDADETLCNRGDRRAEVEAVGERDHFEAERVLVVGHLAVDPVAILVHRVARGVENSGPEDHAVRPDLGLGGETDRELAVMGVGDRRDLRDGDRPGRAFEDDVIGLERIGGNRTVEGEPHFVDRADESRRQVRSQHARPGDVGAERGSDVESSLRESHFHERLLGIDRLQEPIDDLVVRPLGTGLPEQAGGSRNVRSGHRGAVEGGVRVVARGAQDADPRRGQIDAPGPVVRERGQLIGRIGRRHGDHVVQFVAGRIERHVVVVFAVVSGGRHEEMAGVACTGDGVVNGLRVVIARAPTVVGDHRPVGDRVVDRLDGRAEVAAAARIEELERHDLGLPVDADHARCVVPDRGDGSRNVGAVVVVVHRVAVAIVEVVAVDVVDVTVAIVVETVARHLARIDPHVGRQVLMEIVDARVDHGHQGVGAPGRDVPRLGRIDVGIGRPAGLAQIVKPPKVPELGIVGQRRELDPIVRLRVEHRRIGPIGGQRFVHRGARAKLHFPQAGNQLQLGADFRRMLRRRRARRKQVGLAHFVGVEAHENVRRVVRVPIDRQRRFQWFTRRALPRGPRQKAPRFQALHPQRTASWVAPPAVPSSATARIEHGIAPMA